ncbi:phosphotransferase family protein [Streptomyces sp. NPDC059679]|uniref:phosphotransferase family protein n=1 Tax=Streptomyces sp. NPDC059679 TaxID=3346903 RepID=UPI0036CA5F16
MDDYEPSRETLAAIATRHGVDIGEVRVAPPGGANHVFHLGDDLVLRIPRAERFVADLVKEAMVIPAVRRAGVRTPDVVTFDDTRSMADMPYMLLVRAPGTDLAQARLPRAEVDAVFQQAGRELATLHRLSASAAPGLSAVPEDDGGGDPRALVDRLFVNGWIDIEASRWLTDWFDRLSAYLPTDKPLVLVHGDIAPQNLLVSRSAPALTGIVDWGDAQWADPAIEFAKTPLTGIPAMLEGYRQGSGEGTPAEVGSWEARVLWFHLTWALGRLVHPVPTPGERHWTAPPSSRLLGLLRFFASTPPEPWTNLV